MCRWTWSLGRYEFELVEPYTARYWKVVALEGEVILDRAWVREMTHPDVYRASFALGRSAPEPVVRGGPGDLSPECGGCVHGLPLWERAGWLCDSFFTARVAPWLNGDTRVERNFLENFLLPPVFAHLPDGALPRRHPADHDDGVFIPNWAMWFVVELEEYAVRSGDRALIESGETARAEAHRVPASPAQRGWIAE